MMNAMKNKLMYVLFIGILLFPLFGYSQTFRGLSVSDGLSDLVVNALYKDSTGYVWIGTSSTLERFDGIRLKHYVIPGANEKMKEVNVITGMQGNEIWMGNNAGLWRVDGDELEGYHLTQSKTESTLCCMMEKGECMLALRSVCLFMKKEILNGC